MLNKNKTMRMVFDGHPLIGGMTPGLRYILNRPTVREEAVFQGEGEIDGLGVSYGCVVRDGGRYRMWYQAWPQAWDGLDVHCAGLAESDDGLNWKRCSCGAVEVNGSKHNSLTDLPVHCANVIIDASAKSEERYRVFGFFRPHAAKGLPGNFAHLANYHGYVTGISADGIHWPAEKIEPLWPHADVMTVAALPEGGVLLMMKRERLLRGLLRRTFYSSVWRDGKLSSPVEALAPDVLDDQMSIEKGYLSADYYGVSMDPRDDGSIAGFLWNFRHQSPLRSNQPEYQVNWGDFGQVDVSLISQFSRGGAWYHFPGRPTWLDSTNAPCWAFGCIYPSPTVLHTGNESRLYFSGSREYHGWAGAGQDYASYFRQSHQEGGFSRIGLASWPKDRLAGLDARFPEKLYLSCWAVPEKEQSLKLNVNTRSGGRVRVALFATANHQPLAGYSFEDCQPITGDHFETEVRWGSKTGYAGEIHYEKVVVAIELINATIFGFSTSAKIR